MDWRTPLSSILIFGASGRLGAPLAAYIARNLPDVRVRLASSSDRKAERVARRFPGADVVVASYLDRAQMERALDGMEGVFMVMPDFLDYPAAGAIFTSTAQKLGSVRHLVRISADPPDFHPLDLTPPLRGNPNFAAGHYMLRTQLLEIGIPTTTLSPSAYFMDNLTLPLIAKYVRDRGQLIEAERHKMPYVDPADVAEAAARVFVRRDPNDIGVVWHLNNGVDHMDWGEVAALLTRHLRRPIEHVESPQVWADTIGAGINQVMAPDSAAYMSEYLKWETLKCARFYPRPELERLIGRKPKLLDHWISEHLAAWQ
jgi:uncharacterized protein YbjT (DUF2867 family)